MTTYRITGPLGMFTTVTPSGVQKVTLYQNALVPADAPQAEIKHHLSVGLIEALDLPEPEAPVEPVEKPKRLSAAEKKAAADAEAAELADLRTRAIAAGMAEDEVNKATADELRGLLS